MSALDNINISRFREQFTICSSRRMFIVTDYSPIERPWASFGDQMSRHYWLVIGVFFVGAVLSAIMAASVHPLVFVLIELGRTGISTGMTWAYNALGAISNYGSANALGGLPAVVLIATIMIQILSMRAIVIKWAFSISARFAYIRQ